MKVQSVHYIPCQYGGDFCTLITEYRKSLFIPLVFGNPVRYTVYPHCNKDEHCETIGKILSEKGRQVGWNFKSGDGL